MKKLVIVLFALLLAVSFSSGCITRTVTKEKEVIVVPAKKKPGKKHHGKKHHGGKHHKGKVAICHKGKTKYVKKHKVDKYLRKGARRGVCH